MGRGQRRAPRSASLHELHQLRAIDRSLACLPIHPIYTRRPQTGGTFPHPQCLSFDDQGSRPSVRFQSNKIALFAQDKVLLVIIIVLMLIHLHDDMEGREIETTLTGESLAGKEDRHSSSGS